MQGLLIYVVIGVLLDIATGQITGTGSLAGVATGVVSDVIFYSFGWEVNAVRRFAFDIFVAEIEKAAFEAEQQHEEDDEETARRTRALARHNPNTTYLYGEVSAEDLALFGVSGIVGFVPQVTETPFKVAADLIFELTGFAG
jgi:hypothetical protein